MNDNILLVGIDGGASKVSGWEVKYDSENNIFSLGTFNAEKSYRDIPGYIDPFEPLNVAQQLQERDSDNICPTAEEEQQAAVCVEACALVIEELVKKSGQNRVMVGLGMPGLKTTDKRGIAVVANGPRMINYSDQLEARLAVNQIEFAAPIYHLGSDADYCGIGENYSDQGLFRDVDNAYYLGGGTGAADALKLNGELLPFDRTKEWLAKTWEMKSSDGRSLERFASAGGIQSIYADLSGQSVSELNANQIFPLQIASLAAQGDKHAADTFALVVENLSLLIYERISSLYCGSQALFGFVNPNRLALSSDHPFKGKLFQRLIIGQRLGQLFDSADGNSTVRVPLLENLKRRIQKSEVLDEQAKSHYSDLESLIVTSRLREAPALGAGIDAFLNSLK